MNSLKAKLRVEVAPAVPLPSGKRQTYTYHIPDDIVPDDPGSILNRIVSISFGSRQTSGVIISQTRGRAAYPTKAINKLMPVELTSKQIETGRWIAGTMQGGLGFTLRLFYPLSVTKKPPKTATYNKDFKVAEKTSGLLKKISKGTYSYLEKNTDSRYKFLLQLVLSRAAQSRQTLIIMPEVWMVEKLGKLFDKQDKVAFFHAGLPSSTQTKIWHQVFDRQISVIIGTQKALFLPWRNLDTLAVEEEQYTSHKLFDQYPRLHNIIALQQLKKIHGSSLLFSSSFPSLNLYHAINQKKIEVLRDNPLSGKPRIFSSTFDDRRQKHLLPREFTDQLRAWLKKKEKVLVLYNQRGSWQSVYCRICAKALACSECETAFTIHGTGKNKSLQCHQCGNVKDLPDKCLRCDKGSLKYIGIGSEIVEHILNQLAPWHKDIVRIDADTIKTSTDKKIQQGIENKHLIMGTSALFTHVKGRKFDRVAWLFPERGLQYPDFRSYERNYLLLARLKSHIKKDKPVIVVTRKPLLTESVFNEDTASFYMHQLKERKKLNYPPYRQVVRLTISGKTLDAALSKAAKIRKEISKRIGSNKDVIVRGPFQGFQRYRKQKAETHIVLLGYSLSKMAEIYHGLPVDTVDVDPQRIV